MEIPSYVDHVHVHASRATTTLCMPVWWSVQVIRPCQADLTIATQSAMRARQQRVTLWHVFSAIFSGFRGSDVGSWTRRRGLACLSPLRPCVHHVHRQLHSALQAGITACKTGANVHEMKGGPERSASHQAGHPACQLNQATSIS